MSFWPHLRLEWWSSISLTPSPPRPWPGCALHSRRPFPLLHICDLLLLSYVIIPFWHLLSNFNEMTQANKLSLNFPSLCPMVLSFINWTANVVLISSFLQLNLKWPRRLVVYGLELLFLDTSIHGMTPLLFFFLPHGDEWTRHTVSRHPWSWQRRDRLQVSVCLPFFLIQCLGQQKETTPTTISLWYVIRILNTLKLMCSVSFSKYASSTQRYKKSLFVMKSGLWYQMISLSQWFSNLWVMAHQPGICLYLLL